MRVSSEPACVYTTGSAQGIRFLRYGISRDRDQEPSLAGEQPVFARTQIQVCHLLDLDSTLTRQFRDGVTVTTSDANSGLSAARACGENVFEYGR